MKRRSNQLRVMLPLSALSILACDGVASANPMDDLVATAKKEGQLTVIGLPRDWCGYGTLIDGFKAGARNRAAGCPTI